MKKAYSKIAYILAWLWFALIAYFDLTDTVSVTAMIILYTPTLPVLLFSIYEEKKIGKIDKKKNPKLFNSLTVLIIILWSIPLAVILYGAYTETILY